MYRSVLSVTPCLLQLKQCWRICYEALVILLVFCALKPLTICRSRRCTTGADLRRIWLETNLDSFTVGTKVINQNINYHVLHEQEYDEIRTIVELTDCKFGLSANGLSRAENDELLRRVCCQ